MLFNLFKKKEHPIDDKMTEYIELKCKCGEIVIDEPADEFMLGFEDATLEEIQNKFSCDCSSCRKHIRYSDLDERSKKEFNRVVEFFIKEVFK